MRAKLIPKESTAQPTRPCLAQQWNAEDEEEQERERRRRHRQLSSVSEVKEETTSTVQTNDDQKTTSKASNRFCSSSETKPLKLGKSKVENERTLADVEDKQEEISVRRRVEMLNNVNQAKKQTVSIKRFEKKPTEQKAKSSSELIQEPKHPIVDKCGGQVQQKETVEQKQQNLAQEKKETILKVQKNLDQEENTVLEKNGNLDWEEKPCPMGNDEVFQEEEKILNSHVSPTLASVQNEVATKQPQRASLERKSISRLEVKIQPRVRNFIETSITTSASGPQVTERNIPKLDNETASPTSGQGESEVPLLCSRPLISYSSSFKRISPRTISFRVVSRKDKQDDGLSRSASMRLPASTPKLEEKLEKYTSAVQRAGSIRLSSSARRNFQPPAEGVASKRSIFEANVPSRADPPTLVRKESLKIPGGVTSRINLWISRTQEPGKDEGTKDIRRIESSMQQNQWGTRSDDS
ncbi:ladinin-1 isoform X2 [Anolis carolinensis]|uniref:ladinin-1 isoform X2 n=1 Tax=Anolis carolinensis TaxID=28377 RepID=UPI002F2B810D